MTLEEHVDNICNWKHNLGLRNAVLEQMREVIEECAKIADAESDAETGGSTYQWSHAAESIAEQIRALAEVVPFKKVG